MGVCRWRTRDVWWRAALLLLLVLASPASSIAQTALDPRFIEFQSPDHLTVDSNNVPLIDSYELNLFEQGASTPVATVNLGKPPLASDGSIHLDLLSVLPKWPLPAGALYEARITALGPTGSAVSGYSNPFTFTGPCSVSASPASATAPAAGATGSLSVSAGSSCQWTATSAAPWISLAGTTGTGAASLGYTVAANTSSSARTGSITVGSTIVTITQAAGGCGFSVNTDSISLGSAAAMGTLNVLSPNGCNWTLGSQASWITLYSIGGTVSKTIAYGVSANADAASRTGTFTVAGIVVTVTQSGTPSQTVGDTPTTSNPTTTPTDGPSDNTSKDSSTEPPAAKVLDPQVLEFTASPDHFAVGPDGQPVVRGYELVVIEVPQNTTVLVAPLGKPAPDSSGMIRIELTKYLVPTPPPGVTYEARVNALGVGGSASSDLSNPFVFSPCTPAVTPGTTSFAAFPGLSSATVTAPASCLWTTSSASAWITVGSGGAGSQTVSYSIASNTSASPRTGSITIAGRTIAITQDGVAAPPPPSSSSSAPKSPAPTTAQFLRVDTKTQGSWRGVYGQDGYSVALGSTALPVYAQVGLSAKADWTWTSSTADVRALQYPADARRIAATWYSVSSFFVDVTLTDGQPHAVALYLLDWDASARTETIDVLDPATGAVLDTRSVSSFTGGTYLVWQISGKVRFRILRTGGPNSIASGIFFGAADPAAAAPTASLDVSSATIASGQTATLSWATTDSTSIVIEPGIGTVAASGSRTVAPTTTTTYALTATGAGGTVTRQSTVTVVPLPTATLSVTPSVTAGQPATLTWSTTNATSVSIDQGVGPVKASGSQSLTPPATTTYMLTASNAVGTTSATATVTVTAVATPPPPPSSSSSLPPLPASGAASAQYLRTDVTTQGNWKGAFGEDGYQLAAEGKALPSYAQVTLSGSGYASWVWNSSTTDVRALSKSAAAGRQASTWYASPNFSINVGITDGKRHAVALYVVDFERYGRRETIEVIDTATGAVLDTRAVSGATDGQYLVWEVSGRVTFRITSQAGPNAIVSGVFFDTPGGTTTPGGSTSTGTPAAGLVAPATFVGTDTATQGNWRGRYGADGYSIAQDVTKLPAYAQVARTGSADWVWNPSPTDARSLQRGTASTRIASTWYASSAFVIDVTITDGQTHPVSLYLLDYDSPARTQTIEVIDLATGTVVDTRSAVGFTNGVYYTWQAGGKIRFKVTRTGGANATVSGIFFGAP